MIELNLSVLLEIFEHSKNLDSLEVFIQFGSCEEYGNAHSPFKENIREQPNSPYGLVKQLTTNTCMMLYQNYRFPSIVIRPSNVFGAFQNKKKFIPYVIKSLIKNDTLELTPCEQKRDFIHVADLIAYIHKILKNYGSFLGEIVNICTNKDYSLKSIVEYIRKITHSKSKIIYGAKEYRESEIMSLKCDNRKIIEKTSRIEIDLWKRIKELIELYRKEQIY
jgi:nucleoside-diphosphate-sugar epimerase